MYIRAWIDGVVSTRCFAPCFVTLCRLHSAPQSMLLVPGGSDDKARELLARVVFDNDD